MFPVFASRGGGLRGEVRRNIWIDGWMDGFIWEGNIVYIGRSVSESELTINKKLISRSFIIFVNEKKRKNERRF